jgi:DNA-binding response OmpR family regulator
VEYPSEATVRSHLRYLRQKLKLAGVPEDPIETLRGRGYCLKSLPSDRNSRQIFSTLPAKSKDDKLSSEVCLLKEQNLVVLSTSCPKYRYKSNQQLTTLPEDNQPLTEHSPLLLVIDHDRQFTELLSKEAIAQGIRTAIAPTPELARNWLLGLGDGQLPHLAILRLSFLGSGSNPLSLDEGLSLIAEFNSMVPSIPAIVIADRDQFEDRLLVARQGGTFFLKQPVTPTEAIFFGQKVLGSDSQGKKVMIVDEDVELLKILPSLLQPWGFKLTTLDDPRQFWDVLEAVNPDLVLLEMEMPYLSGIELCRVVRTHPHWYKLPVLFFSADKNVDMRAQALASGADDFLSKPFVIKELGDRIIHHLERRIV